MKKPSLEITALWIRRVLFIIFLLSLSPGFAKAQSTGKTIFLVRHAEKAEDLAGDRDPDLNDAGFLRSEHLADILSTSEIKYIYSTDFKRTTKTGLPLANSLGIKINKYNPREEDVLKRIISETGDSPVLIIGHSNTVPDMVNELIGRKKYNFLDESEYDKLFIVSVFDGYSECIVIKY